MLAAQNPLSPAELSTGSATIAFFRSLGGALGVSVLGAILGARIKSDITSGLASLGIDGGGSLSDGTLPNVHELPAPIAKVVESAYGAGVAEVFLIAAPIALITLVAILFIKEVPLGTKSNLELRMEQLAREEAQGAAGEMSVIDVTEVEKTEAAPASDDATGASASEAADAPERRSPQD